MAVCVYFFFIVYFLYSLGSGPAVTVRHPFSFDTTPHQACYVSPSLFTPSVMLLQLRLNSPVIPRSRLSSSNLWLLSLLLLSGNVESNPGPLTPSSKTGISLGSLNVRSAVNKAPLIHDIIADNNLDLLSLTETWIMDSAPPSVKDDIAPPGFKSLHMHRRSHKHTRGGGLAVVFRDGLIVKPHSMAGSFSPRTFELQLLSITSSSSFTLLNIYRPPSSSSILDFCDELSDILSDLMSRSTNRVIVCGDLNCPGTDQSSLHTALQEVLDTYGLRQYIHQPTRGNNLLDIVAGESECNIQNVLVLPSNLVSDHCLVVFNIGSVSNVNTVKHFTCRNLKSIDVVAFENAILNSSIFTAPSAGAETFALQVSSVTLQILDTFAPLKSFKKNISQKSTPWLSAEVKSAKRDWRRLERKWLRTGLDRDRVLYHIACRKCNHSILAARRKFFLDTLQNSTSSKLTWRTANTLLHNKKPQSPFSLIDTPLCSKFVVFFCTKIATLRSSVHSLLPSLDLSPFDGSLFLDLPTSSNLLSLLPEVAVSEVMSLLNALPCKTCGLDFLPTSLLKACSFSFSQIITRLANLSFSEGVFPTLFKVAQISPILKKPNLDSSTLSNFRPISNLNNISKILEKLFMLRVVDHVSSCDAFNSFQSAYRKGCSTETALLHTVNSIRLNMDASRATLAVGLDLSAAFDTVSHSLLLQRLAVSFGFHGPVLLWVESYLSGRSQFVCIDNFHSSPLPLDSGVPQGSVLGPLLFSLYTAPVSRIFSHFCVNFQQYADDILAYTPVDSSASPEISNLEACLSCLCTWLSLNYLVVNQDKSETILFGSGKRLATLSDMKSVLVAGSPVTLSSSIKVLGVFLDNTLSMNCQIASVCKAASFHTRALSHIRSSLNTKVANSIACALVHSRFDYCNSLYPSLSTSNLNKLRRAQNRVAKVVYNRNCSSSSGNLTKLHWLPIDARIRYKTVSLTHKILHTGSPLYLATLLKPCAPVRVLRSAQSKVLEVPRIRSVAGSFAFAHYAPVVWNSIPLSVREPTAVTFHCALKSHLFLKVFPVG